MNKKRSKSYQVSSVHQVSNFNIVSVGKTLREPDGEYQGPTDGVIDSCVDLKSVPLFSPQT